MKNAPPPPAILWNHQCREKFPAIFAEKRVVGIILETNELETLRDIFL
jgi:hypothetical protein